MPKYLAPAIVFGIGTAAFWGIFMAGASTKMIVLSAACGVMAVIFLLMFVLNKVGKGKLSGWKMFAICDIVLMIAALLIGLLFDNPYTHGENLGDGWLGAILLWYGLPLLGGLLIVELLAYNAIKSKKADSSEQAANPSQKLPPRISYPAETQDKEPPKDA